MPTVRVYIAAKNTPVYEPDTGTVESSAMGHMWYEIVDDNGNVRRQNLLDRWVDKLRWCSGLS